MASYHIPLIILFLFTILPSSYSKLKPDYYAKTCPQIQKIIQETVTPKQITNPTTAAATLRLFFHDCFVGGCDASLFVASNSFNNRTERDADINLSLPGDAFDVIVRAKTALELECPGIVSCADIIALATRNLIQMVGGPFYQVRLGRKDGLVSNAAEADKLLPNKNNTIDQNIKIFESKGFTIREMVALIGSHTIGFSHCKEFADRIFNKENRPDPTLNPTFAERLKIACANYETNPTMSVFNDVMTPGKFDNMYYTNLQRGLGLLASDQALISDPRTKPFVEEFAADQQAFFDEFAYAMEKLSRLDVKAGLNGEIRRKCDVFNHIATN